MSAPSYQSADIPLMYGSATVDCTGHGGVMRSVTLSLDGPVGVNASLTPENARNLAAALVQAAQAAELRVAA